AVGTSAGLRRKSNQDRACFMRFPSARQGKSVVVALVCDGLGGMQSGDKAAAISIAAIAAKLAAEDLGFSTPRIVLDAVKAANQRVFQELRGEGGTTL